MNKRINKIDELLKLIEGSQSFSDEEKLYYMKFFQENPLKVDSGINILQVEYQNREKAGENYVVGIIRSISDYLEYCKEFDKKLSQNKQDSLKRILNEIKKQEEAEGEKENIEKLLDSL